MNFEEIAGILGGNLLVDNRRGIQTSIRSISIDSRNIVDTSSCLFFAIKGARHDGHQFLKDLYSRGVRNFVISDNETGAGVSPEAAVLLVPDTLAALQKLTAAVRKKQDYPVLGITGSNGKTIVKEWLFELLQHDLSIVRNPKSYNSQVGVPLSVWNMDGTFDLGIFEAGISEPGEMEKLAGIIAPTVGLITNIGSAHQENFMSLEEKADEKLILFTSCDLIIYRRDQELVHQCISSKYGKSGKRIFSWSMSGNPEADLLIDVKIGEHTSVLSFDYATGKGSVEIPFTDDAGLENACHCLAFIIATGKLTDAVLLRFSELEPVAMRLELKQGINNCTLVNDYYNSDINSLEIALQFLNRQAFPGKHKQVLILSDIRQSGMPPESLAREVARLVSLYRIDRFIGIGTLLSGFSSCFSGSAVFYNDTDSFLRAFNPFQFKDEQILLKGAREFRFERIASSLQKKYHQTQLEINLNALVENLNCYRALLNPATKIMIMVKAFSYGSGTIEIARALEFQKVDYLAVAVADEGIDLRQAGITTPIIVMNPEEHSFETMLEYRLEPNIYSVEVYRQFDKVARRMAVTGYPVHLKLETGMHRLGFSSKSELLEICNHIASERRLYVRSVFSHLAAGDDPGEDDFSGMQYARFRELSDLVVESQSHPVIRHLLNTAGIERFPEYQMEMARLGIGLYGIAHSPAVNVSVVARWTTVISQVGTVLPGETVGYGRKGKVERESRIAVIPVGYADGYDRRLSNGKGRVWVNGHVVPVIGNICMDMTMIDVTGTDVKPGDPVELMGTHISLEQIARWMGTIPYEVLTGISQRVRRVYVEE